MNDNYIICRSLMCVCVCYERYLKFARDVPQAAWTTDGARKGRNSVEEIVSYEVQRKLEASAVKMHSCGMYFAV